MISQQFRTWGILNDRILDIYQQLARETFLPSKYQGLAYADTSLSVAPNRKILPPKEQAKIIQALAPCPSDKVLQFGVGEGFLTAVMAKLSQHVWVVDPDQDLLDHAKQCLLQNHIENVTLISDVLPENWFEDAPFEAIILTESLKRMPKFMTEQLTIGGRLFAILGNAPVMEAVLFKRLSADTWQEEKLFETLQNRFAGHTDPKQFEF